MGPQAGSARNPEAGKRVRIDCKGEGVAGSLAKTKSSGGSEYEKEGATNVAHGFL